MRIKITVFLIIITFWGCHTSDSLMIDSKNQILNDNSRKQYWNNFVTGEIEFIETPKDFSNYVPQIGGLGLYQIYVKDGMKPLDAALKVLYESLEDTEQLSANSNDINSDDKFIIDDSFITITGRMIFDSFGNAKIDSINQAKLDSICKERGHILDMVGSTLIYCPPEYVDLPDRTIKITYDQNTMSGFCKRCGRYVKRPAMTKPDTVTVWKKFSY